MTSTAAVGTKSKTFNLLARLDERRRERLAWLGLTLAVLAVTAPVLCGRVLYYGDITVQFVPWRGFARQQLLAGHVPLWLPGLFCGMPFVGNSQSAVFYPFHWLAAALWPPLGISLGYVLHLWLSCAGGYLLGRTVGRGRCGSLVLALAYGLSGYLISKQQFPSLAYTIAWLPWLLWAGERLWQRPDGRRALCFAGIVGVQWLTGHAQMSFLQLCLTAGWLLVRRGEGPARRRWGLAISAVVLGTACGAVQILPVLDLLRHSPRTSFTFQDVTRFWMPPSHVLMSLWPRWFGALDGPLPFLGFGAYWEVLWYVGLVTLPLAASTARRRPLWALLGVAGLVLAFGPATPLYELLFKTVPLVRMFRDPARFSLFTVIALAALAAEGLEDDSGRPRQWALGLAIGLAVTLLVAALAPASLFQAALASVLALQPFKSVPDAAQVARAWQTYLTFGLLLTTLHAALICWILGRPAATRRLGVVVLLAVDLVANGLLLNPTTSPDGYRIDPRIAPLADSDGTFAFTQSSDHSGYARFFNLGHVPEPDLAAARRMMLPDVTSDGPLRVLHGYDPLAPAAVDKWAVAAMSQPPEEREATLAALGVLGEWDGETWRPYADPAPEVRSPAGVTAESRPTPQRRVIELPAGDATTLELLQTPLPGWHVRGATGAEEQPIPVVTALDVPASEQARTVRLWYSPTGYRAGLFVTLLVLAIAAALAMNLCRRPTVDS